MKTEAFGKGANGSGQLGNGTTTGVTSPLKIENNQTVQVAASSTHTLYVKHGFGEWGETLTQKLVLRITLIKPQLMK